VDGLLIIVPSQRVGLSIVGLPYLVNLQGTRYSPSLNHCSTPHMQSIR
jgi:hypothetical protein